MGNATLAEATVWRRHVPEEEDYTSRHRAEVEQARLDWSRRKPQALHLRIRWDRFYTWHKHSWRELKEIKRELEAKMILNLDVMDRPSDLVTGATWTAAASRVEEAQAELDALKGAFRRLVVEISKHAERFAAMSAWLDSHPDLPEREYKRREAQLLDELRAVSELSGWPSDTVEDRGRILRVAERLGYPAVPDLRIKGTAAGWSVFLASDVPLVELQEAVDRLRRLE